MTRPRAVLALVDPRELVDLASALIRIPSFKTKRPQVALFLQKFFRSRDYAVDLQEIEPGRSRPSPSFAVRRRRQPDAQRPHRHQRAHRRWKRDPWTPSLEAIASTVTACRT